MQKTETKRNTQDTDIHCQLQQSLLLINAWQYSYSLADPLERVTSITYCK